MQILSSEDVQLNNLKCLLIPLEFSPSLICLVTFIHQLDKVQSEFE